MARQIDGTRAVTALAAIYQGGGSTQRAPTLEDLVIHWRAAARVDTGSAIKWWKSQTVMGSRLRKGIPTEEVADLFAALPPKVAVRKIMYWEDRLEKVAAKRLPRSAVLAMWSRGFDSAYEALHAWGGRDPLGQALRRHLDPETVIATWCSEASRSLGDALSLWEDDGLLGEGLQRHVDADTFFRFWRKVALDNPWWAARLLDCTLKKTLYQMNPLDLAPLATANDHYAREAALRHLEQMIERGLPEPEDTESFIEEWREIMPINDRWAAKLILAAPASVRNKLKKTDVAMLLESPDERIRLEAISTLRKHLRSSAPD